MTPTIANMYPVATNGECWLLLENGVKFDKENREPIFYLYKNGELLPDPLPLQQWLKYIDLELLKPGEAEEFAKLAAPRMIKVVRAESKPKRAWNAGKHPRRSNGKFMKSQEVIE